MEEWREQYGRKKERKQRVDNCNGMQRKEGLE